MAAAVVRKFHLAPLATPWYGVPMNEAAAAATEDDAAAVDAPAAVCASVSAVGGGGYTPCCGSVVVASSLCCCCCCCCPYSPPPETSDSTDCCRSWSSRNWFCRFHFVLHAQHAHTKWGRVKQLETDSMYNSKRYEVNTIIVHVPNGQQTVLLKCIFVSSLKRITLFRHLTRESFVSHRLGERVVVDHWTVILFFLTFIFVHLHEIRSRSQNDINVNDGRTNWNRNWRDKTVRARRNTYPTFKNRIIFLNLYFNRDPRWTHTRPRYEVPN